MDSDMMSGRNDTAAQGAFPMSRGVFPLSSFTGSPMETGRFLLIAGQCAQALEDYHQQNRIHQHVNPGSLLWNEREQACSLIEPSGEMPPGSTAANGFSGRLTEKDLPYISPEQTGRMNRTLDYRTDLYSLGIVFYELISGVRPFQASDIIGWVHNHIARLPVSPAAIEPAIPAPIAAIIMKLISKTPEKRYQTARGLKNDLDRCRREWEASRELQDFPLGGSDLPEQLLIPQKLYGREKELALLNAAFRRICSGRRELLLISGYAGIGKTSLMQELYKPVADFGAFLIEGKFDQLKRGIPYSAFIQVFRELVRQLLMGDRQVLERWQKALASALGPNGQVMIDVIPEVELLIGPQPALLPLNPDESRNRFNMVFQDFVQIFTTSDHPLVICIDDLHYADPASFKLLETLLTDIRSGYFLLVATYREAEVDSSHILPVTIDNLRKQGVPVADLRLEPLHNDDVNAMLADMLQCEPPSCSSLAEILVQKTLGNPFFINQLLRQVYEDGKLFFDAGTRRWHWDLKGIMGLGLSENVIDFLAVKISKLSPDARQLLPLAACIGMIFDTGLLGAISGTNLQQMVDPLGEAVHEGLIVPRTGLYVLSELDSIAGGESFQFCHDRIQEAAYALLEPELSRRVHVQIGRQLLSSQGEASRQERIFEIVDHFNRGLELLSDETEKLELAGLNMLAGQKAKTATAYDQASDYLTRGLSLLPADPWEDYYRLAFALNKEKAECEYLLGQHESAGQLFDYTLEHCRHRVEKAEIYNLMIVLYAIIGQFAMNLKFGMEALRLFGYDLPAIEDRSGIEAAVREETACFRSAMGKRHISDLLQIPVQISAERDIVSRLIMNMLPVAFITDPAVMTLLIMKALNAALKDGIIPEDDYIFAAAALVLGTYADDYESAYEYGQLALLLNEQNHTASTRGIINHIISFLVLHWKRPFTDCIAFNRTSFHSSLEAGDYINAMNAAHAWPRLLLSYAHHSLQYLLDETEASILFLRRIRNYPSIERQELIRHVILNLVGLTEDTSSFSSEDFDECQHLENMRKIGHGTAISNYFLYKMMSHYLYGRYDEALQSSMEGEKYLPFIRSFPLEVDFVFFQALAMIAAGKYGTVLLDESMHSRLESSRLRLKRWANECPANYFGRYALLQAEMEIMAGEMLEAQSWYEKAIDSARDNEHLLFEALALELAASHYLERGMNRVSAIYLQDSRSVYARWGAGGKVRQMEQDYKDIMEKGHISGWSDISYQMGQLDALSVIKSSQAISEEIVLPRLLETLLRTVLETAGAQKAALLLVNGEEWSVRAQAVITDGEIVVHVYDEESREGNVPCSVINLVGRTQETVILDDAEQYHSFFTDPYFIENQPLSVLCLPLVRQSRSIGVLYLENNLLTGAFTAARLAVLELLAAQAVISLENASLYERHIRMEEELTEANRRLVSIIESLPDATFVIDKESRVIAWNRALEEMTGVDKSQILGQGQDLYARAFYGYQRPLLVDIILDLDSSYNAAYDYVRRSGDTAVAESFLPLVNKGQGAYLLGSASILRDAHGNVAGAIETVRDISERRAAEEALRTSERLLSDILNFLPDATLVVDSEQRVIIWNRAIEKMTGIKFEEINGKGQYEYALPFYGNRRPLMLDLLIYPDENYEKQYLWVRREGDSIFGESLLENGRYYLTAAALLKDADGNISGAIETVRDITESRLIEEERLRLRSLLANIIDSMPSILVGTDRDGRVSLWNAQAERQTGLGAQQVLNRPLDEVLPIFAGRMDSLFRALDEHAPQHEDHILATEDGDNRYFEVMIYPLIADEVEGLVVRVDDVTEKVRMQEMMIQSEKMMSVGGLAAGMAHELNNPLSGIIQATQNITNRLSLDMPRNIDAAVQVGTSLEKIRDYMELRQILEFVQGIKESGTRAASIISNMLQFSRRSEARKGPVLLPDLLEKTLELAANDYDLSRGFDFRHVEIVREYAGDLDQVYCAHTEIEQVILNLLKNSAHAMAEQPVREKKPRITLRTRREDDMAVIEVEDNGPGMEEAVKKKIFEPFFTTKAPGLGTGLGLSVSYFIIVNNHNGQMSVDSDPGQGTRVTMRIPIQSEQF